MRIYTGQEIHGVHAPDYRADEPRWIDARELDPILRLIDDNADLMREPGASLKSIKTIIRQVAVWKCPACGVNYTIGSRHFSECKLNPGGETHSFDCPSLESGPCDCRGSPASGEVGK
jgi:hypothetical protein